VYFRLPDSAREFLKTQYICNDCVEKPAQNYFTRNSERVAGNSDEFPTFGIELEVVRRSPEVLSLQGVGWTPTNDATVPNGVEMKSPIYSSFQDVEPILKYISEHIVGDVQSGTHIHVGIDRRRLRELEDYWQAVWTPLVLHMAANRKETESIWGRSFNSYAHELCFGVHRYEAFSCVASTGCTIEYRLPVFRSAEQYSRIIAFSRRATQILENEKLEEPADAENISKKICALYSEIFGVTVKRYAPPSTKQEVLVGITERNEEIKVVRSAEIPNRWNIIYVRDIDKRTRTGVKMDVIVSHVDYVQALIYVGYDNGKIVILS